MAPKFRKKDRVKVLATRFDKEEVEEGERKFSEKWAADGNGIWCYGTITHVYVKKRRQAQEYMIRYDNAESMRGVEEHIETAQDEGESDNDSEEAKDNMDRDSDNASTDMELDAVVRAQLQDNDNEVTDDEAGEVCEGEENEMTEGVAMGETVTKGDDDDPKKKTWTRIAALPTDPRTEERQETTFKNLRIHDDTTELDIFLALLPLSPETLLQIVRDGGDRTNCKYKWNLEHILSALCIIFGAGQFKEGTDLWSVKRKGMMPGPDFGLYLSRDRFEKILRFWAYGPDGTEAKLPENPWEEVDYWVRAFNKNRKEELVVGTDLTPDELMIAWKGKKGNGGIPHLSLVERKPIPLGTEGKVVCEGSFGMCVYIELQKGKIFMARQKWCREYKATTACTVRMLDKLGTKELEELNRTSRWLENRGKKRCVYADSWFASVETALALKKELGLHFTGPIKTAHKYFPRDELCWTLSNMNRGEHIVFRCNEEALWAVGWHDHHFKCYLTTHGTDLPGKPAPKKRQDFETNTNYSINIPRPQIIAKYQHEMGWVDRHNRYRQGILGLHSIWKTKRWQTRIQLELLGVSLVDSFLACLHLLPKWRFEKEAEQEDSLFWKYVCVLIQQLDQTPRHERNRENEVDPTATCVQIRLGQKRIMSGLHKGGLKAVQGRCTSCRIRNKKLEKRGRSTLTAWGCACHRGLYFCKNKTCWAEHLRQVRIDMNIEMEI
jgi:hypothetical protein